MWYDWTNVDVNMIQSNPTVCDLTSGLITLQEVQYHQQVVLVFSVMWLLMDENNAIPQRDSRVRKASIFEKP